MERRRIDVSWLTLWQVGVSPDELRQHTRQTLPSYMVPSAFVFLEAVALTASGKLRPQALPAPGAEQGKPWLSPVRS